MGEGWNPTTGLAWGCTSSKGGWVPPPQTIPRRHPLLDAVGRTDDPCARPAYNPPSFEPSPKFKPPREGYPQICNLDDYKSGDSGYAGQQGALANIHVASGSPQELCLQVQPTFNYTTEKGELPSTESCCQDARELDTLKSKVDDLIGPHEQLEVGMRKWAHCMSPCEPRLPAYPCRGVISAPSKGWLAVTDQMRCKASAVSNRPPGPDDDKPITGREFVEGKRTCDLYPISKTLPARFNNAEWFKGYGCERPAHPFYISTSMELGRFPPTAHTMTQVFYPRNNKFTNHLGKTGMFRNRSLNLASSKNYC